MLVCVCGAVDWEIPPVYKFSKSFEETGRKA